MRLVNGALVVEPTAKAVSEVQAEVRTHNGTDGSLVDELIAERRHETTGV